MTLPTATVKIAWATNPGDTPVWTDVSAYVRGIPRIQSDHRVDLLARKWETGTAEIVFDNTDGRFDPSNASSPYAPNVLPLRMVEITYTWSAVDYVEFVGYIDTFPPAWEYPDESTVTVSCMGTLAVLANMRMASPYEMAVRGDAPVAWWRLGEQQGTTAYDEIGAQHGVYTGAGVFNTRTGLIDNDENNGIAFLAADDRMKVTRITPPEIPFTWECWVDIDPANSVGGGLLFVMTCERVVGFADYYVDAFITESTNVVTFKIAGGGNIRTVRTDGTYSVRDNARHHLAFVAESASTLRIYIDGVDRTSTTTGSSPTTPLWDAGGNNVLYVGASHDRGSFALTLTGTGDEYAMYNRALSASEVGEHYNAGVNPWAGDGTGGRILRVIDIADLPATGTDIDAGQSTLGSADTAGVTALDYVRRLVELENGSFYQAPDGTLVFRDRHAVLTETRHTTPQLVLSDNPSGGEYGYVDVVPTFDTELIKNRVRVQRVGGIIQQADDTTSQARFFVRSYPDDDAVLEVEGDTDSEALDAANWLLAHLSDPLLRFTELVIEPYGQESSLIPVLLGLRLEDRITVKAHPPGSSAISIDVLVEGITIENPDDHTMRWVLQLSPAETQDYWVLGSTAALGDSTRLAY